nr:elongation of fatty acids protein 3-like [Ipomoea batatas]
MEPLLSTVHYWLVDHPAISQYEWKEGHTLGASPLFVERDPLPPLPRHGRGVHPRHPSPITHSRPEMGGLLPHGRHLATWPRVFLGLRFLFIQDL